ncbi:MAG TPA: glycosyltransferase family 4 protein [Candidatus Peribacteria bacterium]|nr:glycosyltransferase family 4 protein [Candidatus Peribacteria bacterium]
MRILFTRFPLESAFGGAEVQTLALMRELLKRGHAVQFLGSCPVLLAESPKLGVQTTTLDIGPPPVTKAGALTFAWRRFAMQRALIQAVQSLPQPPEAVCMLSLSEKLLLTEWLAGQGARVLWIEHDRVGNWLRWNPWLTLLKRAASRATIVCVSELSRLIFARLGFRAERTVSIPNGIDVERLKNAPPAAPRPEGAPLRVGCVARLSEEKGVDVLVHAMRQVPQATLDIVGSGPQEGFLHKIILELEQAEHQSGRIRIQARTEDLPAFYRLLDVLVLPSVENDPFGLVAGEAMAMGIATVVTDKCGIAGHVQAGRDALVVKSGDVAALAKALLSLTDPAVRTALAAAGPALVAESLSIAAMVDAYEKLLKNS